MTYQCDCCGRMCTRIHHGDFSGMDYSACDDCASYEWEAYDEDADPLLYPCDPEEEAYEARRHWTNDHDRSEP